MAPPSYRPPEYGRRKGWKPSTDADYGDGGAFPEIHMAQYPLGMGRKDKGSSSAIIPLTIESDGRIKYEAVLGKHDKKKVYSSSRDLVERDLPEEDLQRPSEEEEIETTERTRAALSALVNKKISAAIPAKAAAKQDPPTYFKYTPQGAEADKQRVIKLVEMQSDPIDPPKFKHKKVARGPGSPPVPIVHSPPRKLTQQDHEDWKIPPCISNWKNQKGFTISLDKRLSADGRGLQKPQINDKFAQFSESLYLAERNARVMVEQRLHINEKLAQIERQDREKALSDLANQARNQRMNPGGVGGAPQSRDLDADLQEREKIREQRRRETEREMRLENLGKKRKREEDRDIGERIALGQAAPNLAGESGFDQRLFNQSQGLSTGFGSEDSYNVFDKALFHGSTVNQMFRPKKGDEEIYGSEADLEALKATERFKASKDSDRGGDRASRGGGGGSRSNPVEFEQAADSKHDEFNFLEEFWDNAKTAKAPAQDTRPAGNSQRSSPDHHQSSIRERDDSRSAPQRRDSRSRSPPSRRFSPRRDTNRKRDSPERSSASRRDSYDQQRDRRQDSRRDDRDRDRDSRGRRDPSPRSRRDYSPDRKRRR